MSTCDLQLLSAYIDGELSPAVAEGVEQHLRICASCAMELQQMRDSSESLRQHRFDDLNARELSNLYAAVREAADEQSVWRIGVLVSALAASVLIVSSVWLMELPKSSPVNQGTTMAAAPQWERMAMTLRAGPLPMQANDPIQLANADLVDWMLQGLAKGETP